MKQPKRLTAAFCRTVKEPGHYGDGGRGSNGLALRVLRSENGRVTRSFTQQLRKSDRTALAFGLGRAETVSLDEARARAFRNVERLKAGEEMRPKVAPALRLAPTFAECRDAFYDYKRPSLKAGSKTEHKARLRLLKYASPLLNRPVSAIARRDIIDTLRAIDADVTRGKLCTEISAIMEWAVVCEWITANPAAGVVKFFQAKHETISNAALAPAEIPDALDALDAHIQWPHTALALRFIAVTAVRSGEARGATWGEIDVDARLWRIPASRMKMGRPHVVPLSDAALAVLDKARALTDGGDLVFPSPRGVVMGSNKLSHPMTELNLAGTPHGLRASFATWAEERDYRGIAIDLCLAHDKKSATTKAYMRHDFWIERVALMEAWGRMVEGREQQAEIVELAAHRA